MNESEKPIAYYHLPGLFEFYELYRAFLPLFREHREYFYDWCDIGSIYGAPADCLWGGGRVGSGDRDARAILALTREYGISARLTFSNSLLRSEHLTDSKCNALCRLFAESGKPQNGVIVHSELLLDFLQTRYPGLYFVSSTTKVLTDFERFAQETARDDFRFVVPDFRLNKAFAQLNALPQPQKDKVEFLCNECCWFGCKDRKACYEAVSRKNLGEPGPEHRCKAPNAAEGYRFSRAMTNPGRQIWREFPAIAGGNPNGDKKADGRVPGVVYWQKTLQYEEKLEQTRMARFKIAGVQFGDKDFFVTDAFSDELSFHLNLLGEAGRDWLDKIEAEILQTDRVATAVTLLGRNLEKAAGGDGAAQGEKMKEQFYGRVDMPFRRFLESVDPADDYETKVKRMTAWREEEYRIARRLGDEAVAQAGQAAFVGRTLKEKIKGKEEERHYSAPEACNQFIRQLNRELK